MSNFDDIISAREAAIAAKLLDPTTNNPNMDAIYQEQKDIFYHLFREIYDSAERGNSSCTFSNIEELLMDRDDLDIKDIYENLEQLEAIHRRELKSQKSDSIRASHLHQAILSLSEVFVADIMLALNDIQTFLRGQGYACSLQRDNRDAPSEVTFSLNISWAHLSQK